MNEVIDFLKSNKFQTECDVTETWQVVDIDFVKGDNIQDKKTFYIAQVLKEDGIKVLSQLFDSYCVENDIQNPKVKRIAIVKSMFIYPGVLLNPNTEEVDQDESISSKTLPGYVWVQCQDKSGHLEDGNQRVVEYDFVFRQYRFLIGKRREWRDIPDGYNFKQFKAFAEAEIGRICGIKDKH